MFYIKLFYLNFKKYLHNLIYAILGAIVAIILIVGIVFSVYKILLPENSLIKASVAIVSEDINNDYMDFALNYLENMSSTKDSLEFIPMSKDMADKKLNSNDIIAIMYFPSGVIDGILYGNNIPVEIYFNQNSSISNVFLTEITKAGGNMLSAAQAGTYTLSELYTVLNKTDLVWTAYNDLDKLNFKYVLSREKCFKTINLTFPTEEYSDTNLIYYYIASAILIFFLVWASSFCSFFSNENSSFYSLFKINKYFIISDCLNKILLHTITIFATLSIIINIIIKKTNPDCLCFNSYIHIFIISLFFASAASFINSISPNSFVAVILNFFTAFIFPFFSGVLLPLSFFPDFVTDISRILPFYQLHNAIILLLSCKTPNIIGLIIWTLIIVNLSIIFNYLKIRSNSR